MQVTHCRSTLLSRTIGVTPEQRLARRIGATVLLLACLLGGCSHALRGGPKTTMNDSSVTEDGGTPVPPLTAAAKELLSATDAERRNDIVGRRLMLIDQAYADYVSGLRNDKAKMDLATGIAGLALGVAGTLTDSIAAKTNYAAAGALLVGGTAIVDQTLFYEQTVLALVAAMDANRAERRLSIVKGLADSLAEYTSAAAYQDLIAYERAGSLLGAIGYIQATAKDAQTKTNGDIRNIVALQSDQRVKKACSSRSLFKSNPKRTVASLLKAAQALGVGIDDADKSDADKIAVKLLALNREADAATVEKIYAALGAAGLLSADCPS